MRLHGVCVRNEKRRGERKSHLDQVKQQKWKFSLCIFHIIHVSDRAWYLQWAWAEQSKTRAARSLPCVTCHINLSVKRKGWHSLTLCSMSYWLVVILLNWHYIRIWILCFETSQKWAINKHLKPHSSIPKNALTIKRIKHCLMVNTFFCILYYGLKWSICCCSFLSETCSFYFCISFKSLVDDWLWNRRIQYFNNPSSKSFITEWQYIFLFQPLNCRDLLLFCFLSL